MYCMRLARPCLEALSKILSSPPMRLASLVALLLSTVGSLSPLFGRKDLPSAREDGVPAVMAWANKRNQDAIANFNGTRMASPTHWEDLVVYQIMPDRFNDGDPSNNVKNIQTIYGSAQESLMDTPNLASLPDYAHGGDIRGVIDRLDYLADMGVGLIFLNPIFGHNGAYHGYCQADLTIVDPNFGTEADMKELVREAHRRGMRVMMDVVVNHMCGTSTGETVSTWPGDGSADPRIKCTDAHYNKDKLGTPVDPAVMGTMDMGDTWFRPMDEPSFFSRCGAMMAGRGANGDSSKKFGDFDFSSYTFNSDNECQVRSGDTCLDKVQHVSLFDFDSNNVEMNDLYTRLMQWCVRADLQVTRATPAAVPPSVERSALAPLRPSPADLPPNRIHADQVDCRVRCRCLSH